MHRYRDRPPGAGPAAGNFMSGNELAPSMSPPATVGEPGQAAALTPLAERIAEGWRASTPHIPARGWASRFADDLLSLLFPHFADDMPGSADRVHAALLQVMRDLDSVVAPLAGHLARPADDIVRAFAEALPGVYDRLWLDAEAIHGGDPAAKSVDEVISAYPGFRAIAVYRLAHELERLAVPIVPRLLTEHAHQVTGIDIHPGARIGTSFCIDHGTGIVIGETTVIGDHVKIYQGVTLGALSVDKSLTSTRRHPTIEDRVVIYANATILGGGTVIGHDSVIGGNVWLTSSVPPHSTVSQTSEARVRTAGGTLRGRSSRSTKGAAS
jgi:serine O-acetyltransferase